ncbi:YbaK/EbsC family protein [Pseudorhodoplanes sp.]|uniref:YbaK/EbsC family protein n=1 Tax=Pseudorhodoplanes sp. TaxID=1934341 RepID=UPI0039190E99
MKPASAPGARRVQNLLGPGFAVVEFAAGTRTSAEAAAAIGCEVAQIAKSLVFRTASGQAVLVVASGVNRVDEKKVGALLGERIERADADFVRSATGYPIGGVAPVGLAGALAVFLDEDLRRYDTLWAAAGTPNAVFQLTADKLAQITRGRFADIAKR